MTIRLSRAEYDRLSAEALPLGLAVSSLLKAKVGVKTPSYLANARAAGFKDAERRYRVTYFCDVCKRAMVVDPNNARLVQAIRDALVRWGHNACHRKPGPW